MAFSHLDPGDYDVTFRSAAEDRRSTNDRMFFKISGIRLEKKYRPAKDHGRSIGHWRRQGDRFGLFGNLLGFHGHGHRLFCLDNRLTVGRLTDIPSVLREWWRTLWKDELLSNFLVAERLCDGR